MMYEKEDYSDYSDDAFYLEIRRQILLLTADQQGDDDDGRRKGTPCRGRAMESAGRYFSWCEEGTSNDRRFGDCSVTPPDWLVDLWRSSNSTVGGNNVVGTGVFIPRIIVKTRGRRNNRPRRKKSEGNKTTKQLLHI